MERELMFEFNNMLYLTKNDPEENKSFFDIINNPQSFNCFLDLIKKDPDYILTKLYDRNKFEENNESILSYIISNRNYLTNVNLINSILEAINTKLETFIGDCILYGVFHDAYRPDNLDCLKLLFNHGYNCPNEYYFNDNIIESVILGNQININCFKFLVEKGIDCISNLILRGCELDKDGILIEFIKESINIIPISKKKLNNAAGAACYNFNLHYIIFLKELGTDLSHSLRFVNINQFTSTELLYTQKKEITKFITYLLDNGADVYYDVYDEYDNIITFHTFLIELLKSKYCKINPDVDLIMDIIYLSKDYIDHKDTNDKTAFDIYNDKGYTVLDPEQLEYLNGNRVRCNTKSARKN